MTPASPIPTAGGLATTVAAQPFHLMIKPSGAACNLACAYCFYLERYDGGPVAGTRMGMEQVERLIVQYFRANPVQEVAFAWQGGEPTLMGVDWFRHVVALQKRYCPPGRTFSNALQTNGTLIDAEWAAFLHENRFLVGLSLDGPPEIHDRFRVDRGGKPTFDRVMSALRLFIKHQVEFNTLTVIGSHNQDHGLKVYRFLRKQGSRFVQFIPLVERLPAQGRKGSHDLAGPPLDGPAGPLTPWSVDPVSFGRFLNQVFDEWIERDVGTMFMPHIESVVAQALGMPGGSCVQQETCGRAVVAEHDGSLYSCDHYVYPKYRLGSLVEDDLGRMMDGGFQTRFGNDKRDGLPRQCRECPVRRNCHGGCPKHRFDLSRDGEPGLNHLCAGYYAFFTHVQPAVERIAALLRAGRPAADILGQRRWLETGA